MWREFVSCPMTHAAIATTRAFATAGGTLHHCANLSVAAFAACSNVWAAWFCSHRPCWLALSRSRAGQACAAVLAEGAVTATTAHTLRAAAKLPSLTPVSYLAKEFAASKRGCRVCGQLNVCMICGWVLAFCLPLVAWRLHSKAGCLKVVGCWSLAFYWQCSDRGGRLCGPSCRRARAVPWAGVFPISGRRRSRREWRRTRCKS